MPRFAYLGNGWEFILEPDVSSGFKLVFRLRWNQETVPQTVSLYFKHAK